MLETEAIECSACQGLTEDGMHVNMGKHQQDLDLCPGCWDLFVENAPLDLLMALQDRLKVVDNRSN